jgi:lipoprotein NlpD
MRKIIGAFFCRFSKMARVTKNFYRYSVLFFVNLITCFPMIVLAFHSHNLAPIVTLTPHGRTIDQSDSSQDQAVNAEPDQDNQWINPPAYTQATYTVKKGDTLYSIAFLAGMDYEDLAAKNHISAPYTLSIGQVLVLSTLDNSQSSQSSQSSESPIHQNASDNQTIYWSPKQKEIEVKAPVTQPFISKQPSVVTPKKIPLDSFPHEATWHWPVKGRVITGFSLGDAGNHGINIAGREGAPIHASCAGQVVYSDNGIPGYGNMIIVKNTKHFLSAYAYNATNLVHTGEWVKQGQVIATMGHSLSGKAMLHFEIRLHGKAVDPMRYLPS